MCRNDMLPLGDQRLPCSLIAKLGGFNRARAMAGDANVSINRFTALECPGGQQHARHQEQNGGQHAAQESIEEIGFHAVGHFHGMRVSNFSHAG
jgi:hypothetical protein